MDTWTLQGLGKGALAPERGWCTRAGAIWHMIKGSPIWEDWAFSLVEGGKGVSCRGPFSWALSLNLLLSSTPPLAPRN